MKLFSELRRAVRNHKYEQSPAGILFPESKMVVAGRMGIAVNDGPMEWSKNLATTEGILYVLDTAFHNQAQLATWYIAPFSANVNPAASWTGANFTANATEFTGYDEATRVEWAEAAAAAGSISNTASKARFTINTPATLYGAGILSASAKSAVTGKCYAAAKFATSRAVLAADLVDIAYVITLTSA